jgi:hypothetical protein
LPSRPWIKEGLEQVQKNRKAAFENREKEDIHRKKGTSPSHPLAEFAGDYEHPGYGVIHIEDREGKLYFTLNGITSVLEHWHYDIFAVSEELEEIIVSRIGMKFTFRNNVHGDIEELVVPFEAGAPDIVFKKKPAEQFSNLTYFRQFCGLYEIYGVVIEVALRDQTLVALIPGQPIYELMPVAENEFNVKSMNSYSVRFVKGPAGSIDEALIILPYGAFSATPVGKT